MNKEAIIAGDKSEWTQFVQEYTAQLLITIETVLRRYGASPETKEDILQELLTRIFVDREKFWKLYDPDKASLSTWLGVIARNATIDALRRQKKEYPLEEAFLPASDTHNDRIEWQEVIARAAMQLSTRQEMILRMSFEQGASVREIAGVLGIREQSVRSQRHKAIEKMRKLLKDLK